MLAFKNTEVTKAELLAVLEAHKKADDFVQGQYFDKGKGCAVGCSLHSFNAEPDDHNAYERLFGIPEHLARLEDVIFEGLSIKNSKKWPLRFTNAVKVGSDLTQVLPKFQIWLLTDKKHGVIQYAENDDQRKAIQACADLYLTWPDIDAVAYAADAARAAANAAKAASAAYAAYAARAVTDAADVVYAVRAAANAVGKHHYKIMADKLIELIKAV